jgi:putative membrane protein
MLLELIVTVLLGILVGTFTGLIPGIHINLIGLFLISLSSSLFFSIEPIYLIVFIVSMAITHTFIDFIPSVFLGCPDTDTELSVLPGHELLKKGRGYEAVMLTAYGSLAALLILIFYCVPFIFLISKTYEIIKDFILFLLIIVSILLISLEKKKDKALFVFLLTGFLGLCVLNNEAINQPLLPLLTGLFGSSMLILSIKDKIEIPKQKISKIKIKMIKPLLGASIASPLCSFLPGLGSGQAAIIGNILSKTDKKGFLVLLGATNTLVMSFSFVSLYIISKTRTGAAVAIKEIIGKISTEILILILLTVIFSGIIAFFLTIFLAKFFSSRIEKVNYTFLSLSTLLVLIILVYFISGFYGLLILIISTFTGIYCIGLRVRRTHMMGCLLLPVIIWYLF